MSLATNVRQRCIIAAPNLKWGRLAANNRKSTAAWPWRIRGCVPDKPELGLVVFTDKEACFFRVQWHWTNRCTGEMSRGYNLDITMNCIERTMSTTNADVGKAIATLADELDAAAFLLTGAATFMRGQR